MGAEPLHERLSLEDRALARMRILGREPPIPATNNRHGAALSVFILLRRYEPVSIGLAESAAHSWSEAV